MKIKELDTVVLTEDLPEVGLRSGTLGTAVLVYGQGAAYEVEFVDDAGQTVAVTMLSANQLRRTTRAEERRRQAEHGLLSLPKR